MAVAVAVVLVALVAIWQQEAKAVQVVLVYLVLLLDRQLQEPGVVLAVVSIVWVRLLLGHKVTLQVIVRPLILVAVEMDLLKKLVLAVLAVLVLL
jgi:hypothetical protein